MASKSIKTIKVPGAKMPKVQAKLPTLPKAPQLMNNLKGYMNASKVNKNTL